jgi:hypothetical protein
MAKGFPFFCGSIDLQYLQIAFPHKIYRILKDIAESRTPDWQDGVFLRIILTERREAILNPIRKNIFKFSGLQVPRGEGIGFLVRNRRIARDMDPTVREPGIELVEDRINEFRELFEIRSSPCCRSLKFSL